MQLTVNSPGILDWSPAQSGHGTGHRVGHGDYINVQRGYMGCSVVICGTLLQLLMGVVNDAMMKMERPGLYHGLAMLVVREGLYW